MLSPPLTASTVLMVDEVDQSFSVDRGREPEGHRVSEQRCRREMFGVGELLVAKEEDAPAVPGREQAVDSFAPQGFGQIHALHVGADAPAGRCHVHWASFVIRSRGRPDLARRPGFTTFARATEGHGTFNK